MSRAVVDLSDLVATAALEAPARTALVEPGGRRMSWAELENEVGRLAHGLVATGVVAGHRVALVLANRIEFVVAYLAVLRVQAVAVPVNPRAPEGEVARVLADSGARLVFADSDSIVAARGAVAAVTAALDGAAEQTTGLPADLVARAVRPRLVVVGATLLPGERGYDQLRADTAKETPQVHDPEKLAALLYTSGSSGRPRAAMLTHRALLANIEQVAAVDPPLVHGDDVVLGVLPLFHVYGLNAVLGAVLHRRATLVLVDRYDPATTLDLIDDEACSVVPVAPPVFGHWLDQEDLADRLRPVRLMLSGSAPLDPAVVERFTDLSGVPVHQGYGLTEAAPVVTSTLCHGDQAPPAGSVGPALPGIELRLVDDDGRSPEGGDPGEIWLRGANMFSGYWPDGADGPDGEGWWPTGDVGFLAPDGDLFLVDRVKDLVIVSGFNVYPTEVEEVLREVPGVAEAAVIGVPDEQTGEAVVAYVRAPGLDPERVTAAVTARCVVRLARFKRPSRVEVVEELPLTVTGKVRKGSLRAAERRRSVDLLS